MSKVYAKDYIDVKFINPTDVNPEDIEKWKKCLEGSLIPTFLIQWYSVALAKMYPIEYIKDLDCMMLESLGMNRTLHKNEIVRIFKLYSSRVITFHVTNKKKND